MWNVPHQHQKQRKFYQSKLEPGPACTTYLQTQHYPHEDCYNEQDLVPKYLPMQHEVLLRC